MSGRVDQREGKGGAGPTVSEAGRAMLADLMKDGLGDHILLLRLYQVHNPYVCRSAGTALLLQTLPLTSLLLAVDACTPTGSADLSTGQRAAEGKLALVLQAWERTGFSQPWARELGLDTRGMRFARDVRRQLESIAGLEGAGLLRRDGGASAGPEGSAGGRQVSSAALWTSRSTMPGHKPGS